MDRSEVKRSDKKKKEEKSLQTRDIYRSMQL